ncbi:DUF2177 family protein [Patescibacteria group bacterium]|nr:DUF2177 family protein [Patescibacteria group bacterium]
MKALLAGWCAALVSFLLADGLWIGFVARSFYRQKIGHLMSDQVQWWAVAIFYPLFVTALLVFVIQPALQSQASLLRVLGLGALFGGVAYAAYDLTNQATLKNWPISMTLVDMAWGACVAALTAVVGVLVARAVKG